MHNNFFKMLFNHFIYRLCPILHSFVMITALVWTLRPVIVCFLGTYALNFDDSGVSWTLVSVIVVLI